VPVEVWGSGGDTLVFLPGLGCHPVYYRRGFEVLAERFRIVVPDLSFRSHRELPETVHAYLQLVTRIASDLAPAATWCGHSFGALVALLSDRPAIACAPSVPVALPLSRMFGRAVWLQLREWVGLEGWLGVRYAGNIMVDYVGTSVVRPRAIFPAIADLRRPETAFPIATARAVVYLCARDELYRRSESRAYLDVSRHVGIEIRGLDDGHDWPITRPERFVDRVSEAHARLVTDPEARTRSSPG